MPAAPTTNVPQWYAEMIDPDYRITCEKARAETLHMIRGEAICLCPGDCNCRHQGAPWHRFNYCGCKAHAL